MVSKVTAPHLRKMKAEGEKIVMLTAYDYPTGKIADQAGVDVILVGDSLGEVVLGFESTLPVTMDMMIHHTSAVVRGASRALVVADMPFLSYQVSVEDAVRNAGRFLQEAGAQAVKLEGAGPVIPVVERLTQIGIPVMGHLGMTPQSEHQFGGRRIHGKEKAEAIHIQEDARALQDAGAFAVVLELIPHELARQITEDLSIPTIGIGAGPYCDGQVLVTHDMIGLYDRFVPKHAKQYVKLWELIQDAFRSYADEVRSGVFPKRSGS
ncbi:MAG TPA: 3-methyl-2-oxobutanoate hydroxymethyltransferase [Armatimonadota bacterium]|nr:3-methyl-2-oxobutanoate hydroxymethyltransferase [Armatimonadota bacterium]HOP79484.1 3-methyl-2-oxobutanoate hydroxymethyltransferase [Armatimonadota bacterium]